MALSERVKKEIHMRALEITKHLEECDDDKGRDYYADGCKLALMEAQLEMLDSIDSRILALEEKFIGDRR